MHLLCKPKFYYCGWIARTLGTGAETQLVCCRLKNNQQVPGSLQDWERWSRWERGVVPHLSQMTVGIGLLLNSNVLNGYWLQDHRYLFSTHCPFRLVNGVMSQSNVNVLSKLCSPFLKVGNSAIIPAIASGLFKKPNIGLSNNYSPNGPNRKKIGSNY